jgi:hypothetical protein
VSNFINYQNASKLEVKLHFFIFSISSFIGLEF